MADAVTEEVLAKVTFDAGAALPPIGELAEVTISLPARGRRLALPNASIHRNGGELGVWALRDGDLEFVAVRLGVEDAECWVQVLYGLKQGDQVVLHSVRPLKASSRITVVDKLP